MRMRTPLAHIRDLLRNHRTLGELLEQRQRELDLLLAVRANLPECMQEHCLDVGLDEARLTLYLDSPAWATRARFLAGDLAAALGERGIGEVRIQVRLGEVSAPVAPPAAGPARHLTAGAVAHLLDAADHLQDPDLRETFRRFAQRHAQQTPEPGD